MLGKRKRDTQVVSRIRNDAHNHQSQSSATTDASEIFRKHFEATFAPLPEQNDDDNDVSKESDIDASDAESEVSAWSGLSESSVHTPLVEVVDYTSIDNAAGDEFHRARQKAFMSSRPPRDIEAGNGSAQTESSKQPDEEDPTERLNLKHDLDLQRLLRESHLLEKSKACVNPAKQRQMALEMRLQALGAKQSLLTQQNMPAAHRIGISKKANRKDALRRKEAKENGVILEKVSKKSSNARRERAVDAPGVGKFSGGTLKLSKRDISSIQGPTTAGKRKGSRR